MCIRDSTGQIPPNNVVKWASKKQSDHVADSTESAETVAAVCATKDVIWLRNILQCVGLMANNASPSIIGGDNKATILNLHEDRVTTTNRYMARKSAVARQAVKEGVTQFWWQQGTKNPADLFTKNLPHESHQRYVELFMGKAIDPHAIVGRQASDSLRGTRDTPGHPIPILPSDPRMEIY